MFYNIDVITQKILKLTKIADLNSVRIINVLTKPDFATKKAIKNIVIDLVLGKYSILKFRYYVIKNRSANDDNSTFSN